MHTFSSCSVSFLKKPSSPFFSRGSFVALKWLSSTLLTSAPLISIFVLVAMTYAWFTRFNGTCKVELLLIAALLCLTIAEGPCCISKMGHTPKWHPALAQSRSHCQLQDAMFADVHILLDLYLPCRCNVYGGCIASVA